MDGRNPSRTLRTLEFMASVRKTIHCDHQEDKLLSLSRKERRSIRKTEDPAGPEESVILCNQCLTENYPEKVRPEIASDSKTYRLHFAGPGSFCCCYTDLIFELRAAVNVTYHFDSWHAHLDERKAEEWMVAGPLLNIQANPEKAVAAVHFPHFLCLADEDSSQVHIAHFVEEGMRLDKPDGVSPFHAVWKNPSFSPHGVVFKRPWFKRKIKVHAVALLYQELEVPLPKFHLYLLPNDSSIKMAVQDHEVTCLSWRVQKPPGAFKALTLGSLFFVKKLDDVTVCPKELELRYLQADMEQQYLELYVEHMQDKLELILMEKDTDERVWEACVRQASRNCSFPMTGLKLVRQDREGYPTSTP